jgi:hypothetical protein
MRPMKKNEGREKTEDISVLWGDRPLLGQEMCFSKCMLLECLR